MIKVSPPIELADGIGGGSCFGGVSYVSKNRTSTDFRPNLSTK
jgi:hypothetical protein